jgi:hypothetical protein
MVPVNGSAICHSLRSVSAAKRDDLLFAKAFGRREEEGIGAGSGHLAGSTAGMKLRICEKISFASTLLARKHT